MEGKSPADIYNEDLDDLLSKWKSEPSNTVPFYVYEDNSDDEDDSDDDDDAGSGSVSGSGSGSGSAPTIDDGAGPVAGPSNVAKTRSMTM